MGNAVTSRVAVNACAIIAGFGIAVESAVLATQGCWLLAGLALLLAPVLGMILLVVLSVASLKQGVMKLEQQLDSLEKQAYSLEKQVRRAEKHGAVQRDILEGKIWSAAIPLPVINHFERRGYLAAVVIVKDEGPYLREWLEFHRLVGVQHVYLYDNGSSDGTEQVLSEFIRAGYVTRIPWSTFVRDGSPQRLAYAHAISNFGPAWRWMALIDADEFLFPTEADNLTSVLPRFEHFPSLAVYWRTFGFSGHEKYPPGLVIENFTMRSPFPPEPGVKRSLLKFKSLVDPSRANAVVSSHVVKLENGFVGAYTENGTLVSADGDADRDRMEHAANGQLRINHYYTKTKDGLERKLARGSGAGMPMLRRKEIVSKRIALIEADLVEDKIIQRFLPALRRNLGLDSLK